MNFVIIYLVGSFLLCMLLMAIEGKNGTGKDSPKPKSPTSSAISLKVTSPTNYSNILNSLENIAYSVIVKAIGEVSVAVQVRKIDNTYCKVTCSFFADISFNGVSFGDGFSVLSNDHVCFETHLATGFTTPNDVKQEILLQFHWNNLPVSNTQMSVYDYGGYINTPLISYSFTAEKTRT